MTATAPMIGELAREIEAVVGPQGLISRPEQLRVYESDGLTVFRQAPALVVLPVTTEEVRDVVRLCRRYGVPFVPRGSGTGLSGGALPVEGCVVIGLSKMQRIHEVDLANQRIVVEPGVLNLWVTQKVAPHGYYYAPDPSSQQVCSIGGNVAENSGGAHCLKYGFTVNHVLGMEIVTPDGDVVEIGGAATTSPASSSGPRGCSGSAPRSPCGWSVAPSRSASRSWRSTRPTRPARRCRGSSARGSSPRRSR